MIRKGKYYILWLGICFYLVAENNLLAEDNLANADKSNTSQQIDSLDALLTSINLESEAKHTDIIVFELNDPRVNIDIEKTPTSITVRFLKTGLSKHFKQNLNISDLAISVTDIDVVRQETAILATIRVRDPYKASTHWHDNQYIIRVESMTATQVASADRADLINEPLSLNFHNIDLRSVLQIIADVTSLNLVVSDSVTGNITIHLDQVPWDQALDTILKAKGLGKRRLGNILMVAPAEEIAEQKRLQIEANIQSQQLAALDTAFLRIKYADASVIYKLFIDNDSLVPPMEEGGKHNAPSILSNRGNAVVDKRTNTIVVTDTAEKIADFKQLIAKIDVPIKQVLIEARIVIANTDFKKELGVIWGLASGATESLIDQAGQVEGDREADGIFAIKDDVIQAAQQYDVGLNNSLAADLGVSNASGSFSLGYLTDNLLIDLELSALELDGYAEIISQPKVLTADKQQAVIKSGTEIAYQKATSSGATSIEFKEAVLQLEVTPQITPDDRIIVDLLVSQDSVGTFTPSGEPAIDITQIETQVLVGDGQTLVLGGIFHTEEVQSSKKVPILGDIPFFGRLFRNDLRNTEKREILIFLTPKIIDDNLLDR